MFNQIYVKTTMKLLIIVILRQLIIRSGNFALRLIGAISQSVYSSVIKLVHYLIQNMYGNVLKAFY